MNLWYWSHVYMTKAYSFVELFCGDAWVSRVMRSGGYRTASLDIRLGGSTWAQRKKQNPFDLCEDSGFLLLWRHIVFNLVSVIVRCWTFYIFPPIDVLSLLRWGLVRPTYVLKSQINSVGIYRCLPQIKGYHTWYLGALRVELRLALVAILNLRMDGAMVLIGLLCSSFVSINRATNRRFPFDPLGNLLVEGVRVGNLLTTRWLGNDWKWKVMFPTFSVYDDFLLKTPGNSKCLQ